MTWICPYCGFENENEDRIAFNEPLCMKCRKHRIDPDELISEREHEIEDLEKEREEIEPQIWQINEEISSLECEISELRMRLEPLQDDYKQITEEINRIDNLPVFLFKIRGEDPGQTRLIKAEG